MKNKQGSRCPECETGYLEKRNSNGTRIVICTKCDYTEKEQYNRKDARLRREVKYETKEAEVRKK